MDSIETDERSRLMARELIGFFHEMGHTVVTEGIENARQAELVLGYGASASRATTTPAPCTPPNS